MSEIKGLPQRSIGEPSAEELAAVQQAKEENKEYRDKSGETKKLWMEWADKEGIDRKDIEENATFNQEGTVHWDGDCDWRGVTSLPSQLVEVTGNLDLDSLTTLEVGTIVGNVGGHLYLYSLTTLEAGAIVGNVGGHLYLRSLTTLEAGAIAGNVGGHLDLDSLTTLEAGAIAGYIGGDLYLHRLTTLEAGAIAGDIGGDLYLDSLTTLEVGAIAGNVGGNVYLWANNFSSEKQEEVKALYPTLRFEFR